MTIKPAKKFFSTEVDVSFLSLELERYIHIHAGEYQVEVLRKEDGTLQICVDDETYKIGVSRFEDIYGPDPFKESTPND